MMIDLINLASEAEEQSAAIDWPVPTWPLQPAE